MTFTFTDSHTVIFMIIETETHGKNYFYLLILLVVAMALYQAFKVFFVLNRRQSLSSICSLLYEKVETLLIGQISQYSIE